MQSCTYVRPIGDSKGALRIRFAQPIAINFRYLLWQLFLPSAVSKQSCKKCCMQTRGSDDMVQVSGDTFPHRLRYQFD
ncbi:unnamed protein product [Peronospora belbahrii]|uniref:Uncharacterized protein n=1 Tax=Peronospora belbahrii TaxID=622444 RepID=A0ABN8CQM8_9STRA|nr:unnamed protein product [Peronospora belbahrii]